MSLFVNPRQFQNDEKGRSTPYAAYYFYDNETYDFKDTYSDIGRTAVNPNPVIADDAGRFPKIYLASGTPYRVVFSELVRPGQYTVIWEEDDVIGGLDASDAVSSIDSVANISGLEGTVDGQQISVGEYNDGSSVGNFSATYRTDLARTVHDGVRYHSPARDLATEGLATYLTAITDADFGVWENKESTITPEMAGANGSADEADSLQASLTAAGLAGKAWRLTNSNYPTSKQIDAPDGINIEVAQAECIIDGGQISSGTDAPDSAIIKFGGGDLTQIADLNADVTTGDVDIAFDAAHGLSKGQIFCIYNPTVGSWNAVRDAYHAGEWCKVVEVIDTTTVKVSSPIFDSYLAASVECYVSDSHSFSVSGGTLKAYSDTGNYSAIRGFRIERVKDSDISNLSAEVVDGHSGINIRQCFNISGEGARGVNSGDSGTGTDYGLLIGNSQHIHIDGYFSATRHGVSQGGGDEAGAVVNRDNIITGTIATTGAGGSTLAADWHGNCEYCTYSGTIIGGFNWGGDKNTVKGDVLTNEIGVAAYASELLGFSFDFSDVKFYSSVDVGSSGRGMFDCGGNSSELDAFTTRGGTLNLSGARFDAPEVTDKLLSIRNRGAVSSLKIDMSNVKVVASNAGLSNLAQINAVSGSNFEFLDLQGYDADQSHSWSVSGVDAYQLWKESGIEGLTTNTGVNLITTTLTFRLEYPFAPPSFTNANQATTGGDRLVSYGVNVTKVDFDVDLRTADNSNFGGATTVDVSWSLG